MLGVALVTCALAALAAARNCYEGLLYCGSTLRAIAEGNNYDGQIRTAMALEGYSNPSWDQINNALFYCDDGDGNILMVTLCDPKCYNNARGLSDACKHIPPIVPKRV